MEIFIVCWLVVVICALSSKRNRQISKSGTSSNDDTFFTKNQIKRHSLDSCATALPNSIISEIRGIYYRSKREIAAARMCAIGDTLILEPEADNEFDKNAVKVYTMEGFHIGYIEAKYSKIVSSNINHISKCRITRVSKHEIPYIDIEICFSSERIVQPNFIPTDFQCGPEDIIRNIGLKSLDSYKYRSVYLMIEGLYELDRTTIAKARACKKGDKIVIKKGQCDEYYPYRLDFYLPDGTFIGHAENFGTPEVYTLFDNIVDVIVKSPISKQTCYRIGVYVFFPSKLKCAEYIQQIDRLPHYKCAYPEIQVAQNIRTSEPNAALDILLPIVKKEKGIDAKIECIACYYTLRNWAARIDMIRMTLQHIESLTEEDLPIDQLRYINGYVPTLLKQLDFSQKRLESQVKKQKKASNN